MQNNKPSIQLFTIVVGMPTCFFHNYMRYQSSNWTFVCPDGASIALGTTKGAVEDEIRRIHKDAGAKLVRVFSTCVAEFVGIDLEEVCERLSQELGIYAYHEKHCRICNRPPRSGMRAPAGPGPFETHPFLATVSKEYEIIGLETRPPFMRGMQGPPPNGAGKRPRMQLFRGGPQGMSPRPRFNRDDTRKTESAQEGGKHNDTHLA